MLGVLLALQTLRFSLPTPPPCGAPFHGVLILQRIAPDVPPGTQVDHPMRGTVQVNVAPDGSVVNVKIAQSTGIDALDGAIVDAAKKSTYQAKADNCEAVSGTYIYQADFGALAGAGSPAPNASPQDPCNHEGRVATWAHVVYPASLRVPQPATALVNVTIGTNGELLDEKIAQSTGTDALDQSALDTAKHSVYAPKMVGCKPIAASYIFKIVFKPH